MKKTLFPLTTAALLMGSVAMADPFTDAVVGNLQELGYDYIEIKQGPRQLKAEAVRGNRKLEVVYDLATGRIIKQEDELADDDYVGRTGIEIDVENRDFLDDDDDDDDDDDNDDDDDDDRNDDDDDDSGRDDDDDDSDDDNDDDSDDDSDDNDDDNDDDSDDDNDDDDDDE